MSPLKVLTRGYSVTSKSDGSLVRSVTQVNKGEEIHVGFNDGSISALISDIKERSQ